MSRVRPGVYILSFILFCAFWLAPHMLVTAGENSRVMLYVSNQGSDTSGSGTRTSPYQTIDYAARKLTPGATLVILPGVYKETVNIQVSGTKEQPITITSERGSGSIIDGNNDKEHNLIHIQPGVSNLIISGLELRNGFGGIYYEDDEFQTGSNITIEHNCIHDINGHDADTFAIAFYAHNTTPATDIVIHGNTVYNCQTDSSETVMVNGNVNRFLISNNTIYNCNNIGIDAIGYEQVCAAANLDCARNGRIVGNKVYNISTKGNQAYLSDGVYDLCAAGIYVDGGHDIEISGNLIAGCNIGIEVASEHQGKKAYNVTVRGNIIMDSDGVAGLVIGGIGPVVDSVFEQNILYRNKIPVAVQNLGWELENFEIKSIM